jgi:hypothetical protein
MSKLLVGIAVVTSLLFVASAAPAKPKRSTGNSKAACKERCWKQYSRCHQPRTGKNICGTQKMRCESNCR